MTVFQLLHWNGTLKALRERQCSRQVKAQPRIIFVLVSACATVPQIFVFLRVWLITTLNEDLMSTCAAAWLWIGSGGSTHRRGDWGRSYRWHKGSWCWPVVEAWSCASTRKRRRSWAWLWVRHTFATCLMPSVKHQVTVTSKSNSLYTHFIARTQTSG